jgi:uncharacterized protein (TIGR03000 family)
MNVLAAAILLLSLSTAAGQTKAQPEPAKLKVFLPSSAILHVDGSLTQSTGEIRNFVSPALPPGQKFKYTLRATWREAGKDIERERTVRVEAGQETIVDFRPPEAPTVVNDKDAGVFPIVSPTDVVEKMLDLAEVKKADVVYDPKCGDGLVLIKAALKFGAKGVGFDSDPQRANDALEAVKKSDVGNLVTIQRGWMADVDFKDATVVALHLSTGGNARLMPQLAKLKPGTRIVSDDSEMKGAKPTRKITYMAKGDKPGEAREHTLYLWIVPWEKE